ncbi:MAG: NAD-dependent epimerase/dehydratase family protein [Gemmatimonadota bacterium]|nr:NAD-dependent epimerase/dehydratase family protein [Gemmatimonadota bacterium]
MECRYYEMHSSSSTFDMKANGSSIAVHPNPIIAGDITRIISSDIEWSRLAGCSVLIAGAAGFLPTYLVEVVMALWHHPALTGNDPPRVIALVRSEDRARAKFAHHLQNPGFTLLVQDVCTRLPAEIRPDFIVHAASPASPKYYRDDPVGTIGPNTVGTQHLLECAANVDAKGFLFFSSAEIYGDLPESMIPTRESDAGVLDPTDPRNCYAESKRLGEALCIAWHRQFGVAASIVRPFHVYGPGMRLDDGRVFADFAAAVVHGRDIALLSTGTASRSFCYLADATEGFFRILLRGESGTAYNLGNPECEISIAELAEILTALYPEKGLQVIRAARKAEDPYMPSKVERSCPDIGRLRLLSWKPSIDIRTGFRRTIDSLSCGTLP